MRFVHRQPAPPLDRNVEMVWYCEGDQQPRTYERVLPTGRAQLIVNLTEDETRTYQVAEGQLIARRAPGTIMTGATTHFQIIDTDEQRRVAGVVFRAGGLRPFIEGDASTFTDEDVSLEAVWGRAWVVELRERLQTAPSAEAALDALEDALMTRWSARECHPAVRFALAAFRRHPSLSRVSAVTQQVALSQRRFIERFEREVGVTPKHYCRILRFQHAVTLAASGRVLPWAQLAADCGYFDQAHFIRDFRTFAGLTPSGFEARRTAAQNHVTFLQSDVENSSQTVCHD